MFSIRRVHDALLPANRQAIEQSVDILLQQIPTTTERQRTRLVSCLNDPVRHRFRSVLLVAERNKRVVGFALLMHAVDVPFTYLDFICAKSGGTSGGIGGALYDRCREEAQALGAVGLFFECWSDEAELAPPGSDLQQNRARLRFYERWGARPIVGTTWDKPTTDGGGLTHLVFDDLGRSELLEAAQLRKVLRAILERIYPDEVPAANVESVVKSIKSPVTRRPFRYKKAPVERAPVPASVQIPMVVTDRHEKHRVRVRGYHETPARIGSIRKELLLSGLVAEHGPKDWPDRHLLRVHTAPYVRFLKDVASELGDEVLYPDVFPLRNQHRLPREVRNQAGWFCLDTFTPLSRPAIESARRAVDCALTATRLVLDGAPAAYSLARPPGHHAERRVFGGYCYYANAAIAAAYALEEVQQVAILDLDFHHGNGQQEIFYERADVLTVSVHGDPTHHYPFFAGFADEKGEGAGEGSNHNIPLPAGLNGEAWRRRGLMPGLQTIRSRKPDLLIVALGFDTAKNDPTGGFVLQADDFRLNGEAVGSLHLPTVVIQEGGYLTRSLGRYARAFFEGLAAGINR